MSRVDLFQAARAALVLSASVLAVSGAIAQSPSIAAKMQQLEALKANANAGAVVSPSALGSVTIDMVYTPITPCRIVDTRVAGGAFNAGETRAFDLDGPSAAGANYASQGGIAGTCFIPYGVVNAAAMNLTVTGPTSAGYLTAFSMFGVLPNASVLNWASGQTIANTTIVPVSGGSGADFRIYSSSGAQVIIDVVGYYAAPLATLLDCQPVASAITSIAYPGGTAVDAVCPAGYVATGGGNFMVDTFQGRPGLWADSYPFNYVTWRTWYVSQGVGHFGQTWAQCCRVPGR
jgi:hypothetical protein